MSEGPTEREREAFRRILFALATGAPIRVSPYLAPDGVALVDGKLYFHGEVERDRFLAAFGVQVEP